MFEVFSNSIVNPKNIINYHNKKGGFVFLYILIMVLLMSISTFVFYIQPSTINPLSTGCVIESNTLVCTGDNYDLNNEFKLYDFNVYFLAETTELSEIDEIGEMAIILQGSRLSIQVYGETINEIEILGVYDITSLEEIIMILKISIITVGIIGDILVNSLIIMFVILISTIPFIRFKKFISYKKIFKMLTFAAAPMAFLFSIYNLINFDTFIFFILMLFAYRSVFALQKEVHIRILSRTAENYKQEDNVINEEEINDEILDEEENEEEDED
ncbi:MAG: hypothetical protein RBR66_01670 [Candidatus Izemoplasmatales bacterium]|jgi:hypothetical protein|nr:hypothetical protein [Candidatus Izemoplasmatales bacterium]